jgi:hypothetical protein
MKLTPKQRGLLGRIAHTAWTRQTRAGAIDEPETEWRRREARSVTGTFKQPLGYTISEAPRAAFDALFPHFLTLGGEVTQAMDFLMGPGNDMLTLAFRIKEAESLADVGREYTQAICARQCGKQWPESVKEARAVLAALVNHAKNKAAKQEAAESAELSEDKLAF